MELDTHTRSLMKDDASSLVRCLAGEDATNGFFVACFVKDERGGLEHSSITQKRKMATTATGDGPKKKKKKKR
jgi:putative methyltransferase